MARIGIIGTGWGARVQVPVFREAGLEVVAIAGHDSAKTRQASDELQVTPFASWRELIASEVDLVTIVTPPSEHVEMACAALAAGTHVLCEKPTALNAAGAEQLVGAAAAKPDRIALIDHELRFLPAWCEARRRLRELGGVRYAEVRYASPSRGDRSRAWNWWSDAARGGGVLGAVGSHFIDSVRYLIGEIDAVQASVNTIIAERPIPAGGEPASRAVTPLPAGEGGATERSPRVREEAPGEGRANYAKVTSDDFSVLNLRLKTGALVTMSMSAAASGPDEPTSMTIHCEDGALRLIAEELLFAKRGQTFQRVGGNDAAKRPGNTTGGAFGTGTFHLALALKTALDSGNRDAISPAATFKDGLAQQRVLDAARGSNQNDGRWEAI